MDSNLKMNLALISRLFNYDYHRPRRDIVYGVVGQFMSSFLFLLAQRDVQTVNDLF